MISLMKGLSVLSIIALGLLVGEYGLVRAGINVTYGILAILKLSRIKAISIRVPMLSYVSWSCVSLLIVVTAGSLVFALTSPTLFIVFVLMALGWLGMNLFRITDDPDQVEKFYKINNKYIDYSRLVVELLKDRPWEKS